jgi:hypothetical protein
MPRDMFPYERLAAAYKASIRHAVPHVADAIAAILAKAFQEQTRHIVDYSNMPPWDDSGELIDTKMPFVLEDYRTVGDFWEEYAGHRMASYESGRGWNYPDFENMITYDIGSILAPFYQQALMHLQHHEPDYYQALLAHIQATYNEHAQTIAEIYSEIAFNDVVGDTEIECQSDVMQQIQGMELAPLLQAYSLPRRCQRAVLAGIANLPAFMDELASYCTSHAHVTSVSERGPLQLQMHRTAEGVTFGRYLGARELLMDRIAQNGAVVLRCVAAATDADGAPIFEMRGWSIEADAASITPHRLLPDDVYQAMNTNADTGAKLTPEPNIRYL